MSQPNGVRKSPTNASIQPDTMRPPRLERTKSIKFTPSVVKKISKQTAIASTRPSSLASRTQLVKAETGIYNPPKQLTIRGKRQSTEQEEKTLTCRLLKSLTSKYGSRGKSAKFAFIQAYRENLKGRVCPKSKTEITDKLKEPGKTRTKPKCVDASSITERPAVIAANSNFIRHLSNQVQREIQRLRCSGPVYDKRKVYNELMKVFSKMSRTARRNNEAFDETNPFKDILQEPEKRMLARLQIYKRAFSALILHFNALGPLLSEIKRVYDDVLTLRETQMTDVRFMKKSILYKEQSMDKYMTESHFECYNEMSNMEKKSVLLSRHIDKQKAAIKLMAEILTRVEVSVSKEYDLHRDALDQKRYLIQEINYFRNKLNMPPRSDFSIAAILVQEEDTDNSKDAVIPLSTEDPLILNAATKICKKDLAEISNRLALLEEEYVDVIPRREFYALEASLIQMQNEHKTLNEAHEFLTSEVQLLRAEIEKLKGECDYRQLGITKLREKSTPRPSWSKIGEFLEMGLPAWTNVFTGQTSNAVVGKLVEELTEKKLRGPTEYFPALGINPKIPRCLRYDNRVRRINLQRRDCAVMIHDIWGVRIQQLDIVRRIKQANEGEDGAAALGELPHEPPIILSFSDFVAVYFEERYKHINLRMEWTYNLVNACRSYLLDQRLTRFLGILETTYDELIYHTLCSEIDRLKNNLMKKSEDTNHPIGFLERSQFSSTLQETFPYMSEESIQVLIRCASKISGAHADWSSINCNDFFVMTDEGRVGVFVDEFGKQFDQDRLKYAYEILGGILTDLGIPLKTAEREEDRAGDTNVSMQQFYSALLSVDPQITDEKVGAALSWVFAGVSALPGLDPKGVSLVAYIKSHIVQGVQSKGDEDYGEVDNNAFEKAMNEIIAKAENSNDQNGNRRDVIKKMKVTSLRTVIQRLKRGALIRHGPRYSISVGDAAEEENLPEGAMSSVDRAENRTGLISTSSISST